MKVMCGRYASIKAPADLADEFRAVDGIGGEAPGPDYNVAPTKPVITVVERHPRDEQGTPDPSQTVRSLRVMRWGLVPSWSKDRSGAGRMINARVETAASKPAYRSALARRRCLLPAAGWYEWKRADGEKQPYFITTPGDGSVALAGLWEVWRPKPDTESEGNRAGNGKDQGKDADPLITTAVLTTDSQGIAAEIHDRMPLVLPRSAWGRWLDPDVSDVAELLADPVVELEAWPVSAQVNSVRNNGPELIEPVRPDSAALTLDL
jgi:putative SOS response-associated peptidase YedK